MKRVVYPAWAPLGYSSQSPVTTNTSTADLSLAAGSFTASATTPNRLGGALPLLLYGVTGFTGVLAEQGFEKYISLLVGATASASATVLFTYFLGFALGGVAAGQLLKKTRISRPLLAYGLVELLVGFSCVAFAYSFHSLMEAMAPFQNLFDSQAMKLQVRFVSGCLLVLPTAALMGASFPLIACALDNWNYSGEKRWSQAYSANLAGSFVAAMITPFAIMPVIGLRGALWLCFFITGCVCAITAVLPEPAGSRNANTSQEPSGSGQDIHLLLAGSFASGAVFFALEVIWTHLIAVVVGSSIYTFSWMLAAVLLGLLLGASIVNRGKQKGYALSPSLLFQCSALLLLVQFCFWDRVPLFFTFQPPPRFYNSFYFAEIFKLYVTAILLVPASAILGLIYPSLLASPQLEGHSNAYLAGYVSAANSLGCLVGALLGGFVLVPKLGSELSLKCIILILGAFWLLFLRRELVPPSRLVRAALVALVIVACTAYWHWDWAALTLGRGNYFGAAPLRAAAPVEGVKFSPPAIVFRNENIQGGLTTITQETITTAETSRSVRTLWTNGKFQGNDDSAGELNAQFGFAAIPSLFVRHYDRALLIGLGTGHTATALRRLGYGEIEIAEFSPGIAQAAQQFFTHLNEGILTDPRVKLHLEDGRNILLTDRHKQYDLVTIEITSVWFAGATNLYSKEFYELVKKRLKPGGVLQQWVQLHHISPREIACDLATAHSVFPYVGLWFYGHQGMLVAAEQPLEMNDRIAGRFQSAGMPPAEAKKLITDLSASTIVAPDRITTLIREVRPEINTDHNRWIEYATPRYQSSSFDWMSYNLGFLSRYK